MWIVPVVLAAAAFGVVDYENLGAIAFGLLVTVVTTSLLVGVGEELMFRGITIQALRDNGMSEHRVALWSSVIFGGAHITNLFTEGSQAIMQVLIVSVSGFFFYLAYRVSGTIVVPMLLRALWDFSLFSHNVGEVDPSPSARQSLPLAANIILVVILFFRRDKIEPAPATAPVSTEEVQSFATPPSPWLPRSRPGTRDEEACRTCSRSVISTTVGCLDTAHPTTCPIGAEVPEWGQPDPAD